MKSKNCMYIIYGPIYDKRDLMAIKVKAERDILENKRPSFCVHFLNFFNYFHNLTSKAFKSIKYAKLRK